MHVVRQICHRVAVMEEGRGLDGRLLKYSKNPKQPITKQFVGEERGKTKWKKYLVTLATSLFVLV